MQKSRIRPIPKKIMNRIFDLHKREKTIRTVFYAYLASNNGELVKVTVAAKRIKGVVYLKQVAVHGLRSKNCFVKDLAYACMSGYKVGWYSEGYGVFRAVYEDGVWYEIEGKYADPAAELVNVEYLRRYPEYQYAATELLRETEILKYLRVYEKYPIAELLVKAGLERYALRTTILRKLDEKAFRCWILRHSKELILGYYRGYYHIKAILRSYNDGLDIRETQNIEDAILELKHQYLAPVREVIGTDYSRYLRYLKKQKITHYYYADYIVDSIKCGVDLSDLKIRYPSDFKYWHDTRHEEAEAIRRIEEKKKKKEMEFHFTNVVQKYSGICTSDDKYMLLLPRIRADLTEEGKALHHCVGSDRYYTRMSDEKTLILFLRKVGAPNEPFCTIEYDLEKKKVLQFYANYNSTPEAIAQTFVTESWLPYAKKFVQNLCKANVVSM